MVLSKEKQSFDGKVACATQNRVTQLFKAVCIYCILYVQQCIGEEGGERQDRSRSRRKEEDRDKNSGRRQRRNGLDTKKAAEKGEGG